MAEKDVEADTELAEDAVDVNSLILPNATFPPCLDKFSVSVSMGVVNGWVKQRSPACAGASVAGAFNALCGFRRGAEGALCQDDVVEELKMLLQQQIDSRVASFERVLGAPVAPLLSSIVESLASRGKSLGGRDSESVKKSELREVIDGIVHGAVAAGSEANGDAFSTFFALNELIETEDPLPATTGNEEDEDAEAEEVLAAFGSSKKWQWRADLSVILAKLGGMEKLCRPRPSTALFGNWGVLGVVERLADKYPHLGLQARLFMRKKTGPKAKADVLLSSNNDEETIQKQWAQLRSVFLRKDTALIFHLKNHYALVFAMREWVEADGTEVKEILTARKNQRPTAWIGWKEIRELLIKWPGYGFIVIQRNQP